MTGVQNNLSPQEISSSQEIGGVNFVDTVENDANEVYMNGVKRKAVSPPSVETVSGAKVVGIENRVVNKSSSPLQSKNKPAAAKKVRRKVRLLPVTLKKKKIWSKLMSTESGLSLGEWIYHDDETAKEIIDGIRYLRELKRKERRRSKPVPDLAIAVPMEIEPTGLINEVIIDEEASEGSDVSSTDGYDTEYSEDESVSMVSGVTSSVQEGSFDGRYVEQDLEFSDTESIYRYPYNLDEMKRDSPLKSVTTINGVQVNCVYDTGASVSVIGADLAKKLGLVPNGDKLNLVGFNNLTGPISANIVMDVPISINGKIRPEHMCIQENGDSNLCLLGVPWFKNYGVTLDVQRSMILVPTTDGIMKIKGTTKQIDALDLSVKSKKVYSVQVSQKYLNNLTDDLMETEYEENKVKPKVNGILGEVAYDESNIAVGVPSSLVSVVEKYKNCFSEVSGLSKIKGYQMDIHLKENYIPVRNAPYRLSWSDQEILDDYVKEMLDLDLIEESLGTWTSSLFLLDKKEGGSKRVVVALRGANDQIVKTNYPVATVSELTEATTGAKLFSVFDCTSGYHQLEINPEHREITGFITKSGTYRYKRRSQS